MKAEISYLWRTSQIHAPEVANLLFVFWLQNDSNHTGMLLVDC